MTNAEYMRSYRASQQSYGRCINCRVILPEGWESVRCEKHLRQQREWMRAHAKPRRDRYRANREHRRCDNCGAGVAEKFSRCLPCRKVAAARLRVRRSA